MRWLCALFVVAGCATAPFPVPLQTEVLPSFVPKERPLEKLDDLWVKSSFNIPATGQSVIFGQIGQCAPVGCRPAIFVQKGGAWVIHDFADQSFYHLGWVYVAADNDRRRFWGVLDSQVEGPAWSLRVVVSEDGGQTWKVGESLRKPYYLSSFHSFEFSPDGTARLEVAHDEDAGYGAPLGLYVYRSKDGGLTWLPETFRPNAAWGYREPAHEGLVPLKERVSASKGP
jgi:hypothetical protein